LTAHSSAAPILNSLIPANSGWVITEADAINSSGQIVGSGQFDGQQVAVLLNPTPEPSSLVLGAFGAAGLFLAARRRKS